MQLIMKNAFGVPFQRRFHMKILSLQWIKKQFQSNTFPPSWGHKYLAVEVWSAWLATRVWYHTLMQFYKAFAEHGHSRARQMLIRALDRLNNDFLPKNRNLVFNFCSRDPNRCCSCSWSNFFWSDAIKYGGEMPRTSWTAQKFPDWIMILYPRKIKSRKHGTPDGTNCNHTHPTQLPTEQMLITIARIRWHLKDYSAGYYLLPVPKVNVQATVYFEMYGQEKTPLVAAVQKCCRKKKAKTTFTDWEL